MLLQDWLKKTKTKPLHLAETCGIAPAVIYKALSRKRRISPKTAILIEKATRGEVTRVELVWPELFYTEDEKGNVQLTFEDRMQSIIMNTFNNRMKIITAKQLQHKTAEKAKALLGNKVTKK